MRQARNRHELIPAARRLMQSLRNMGYDFATAVADLVDNSIEARATLVAIDIEFDGDDSWVRIADNGSGMTPPELREALRYGADRDYGADALGKFGLGLKTASLSQCQRLTVASRTSRNRADISAFCWDLDHIERSNRWEIIAVERSKLGPAIRGPLKESTGTVVLWQKLDRILGYKLPYGEAARKRLCGMCRDLEAHLAMVFHRFLTAKIRGRRVRILVNGNNVVPWDPFAEDERNTQKLTPVTLTVDHEGVTGEVKLEPFVLPHQQGFSSADAFRRASGPSNWNQQQGFYIYRAGRLIQSGGWCRLRTIDEHTKLARIALSFMPGLDEAFKINVAKMRVQLPPQIREQVEQAIRPVVKIAQETYRRTPVGSITATGAHGASRPTQASSASRSEPTKATGVGATPMTPDDNHGVDPTGRRWNLDELEQELRKIAKTNELAVVVEVFRRLRAQMKMEGVGS